jgi:hypothetical protein
LPDFFRALGYFNLVSKEGKRRKRGGGIIGGYKDG